MLETAPQPPPHRAGISSRRAGGALALLLLAVFCCLVPFLDKAVHADDPVYIWVARQVCVHPLDFYGGQINWYGTPMRVADFMMNPPLVSFYLAATGTLAGW